jgi:cardiolipin synthase
VEFLVSFLTELGRVVAAALTLLLSVIASAHAVLYKRDSRAAVGWVGLIWFAPIVGAVLYALLGINRIRRQAATQRDPRVLISGQYLVPPAVPPAKLPASLTPLHTLAELVDRVASRTLTTGNAVRPLVNGDEAYPAMAKAIDDAERSVALSTYIFDNDYAGGLFVDALERAMHRGVEIRVLIDTVGARYSWPSTVRELGRRGVPCARFGRTWLPWRWPYFNLRNHRKLLVVDGRVGFTGGMNIREGCMLKRSPRRPVQDLHFRLDGPVVTHLMEAFAQDWAYAAREELGGDTWFPRPTAAGSVIARGINDGPDEDLDKARMVFLGALACAQRSVRIVTPYFLPDAGLIGALDVAALRGVHVEIVLPERSNLALVQWASAAQLWQVLDRGCRVYCTPRPFDHSKLMLVDDTWAHFGSTNWDPRSIRLNFEFDVEVYDPDLVASLHRLVDAKVANARPASKAEMDGRSLPVKLRDGIARLAAPYL